MAEKRMFSKAIIDSDDFLEMPVTARLLYYDLAMRADDDGFVNSPKKIIKFIGATEDDLNILFERKFIIVFDSGVIVIRHWRLHNYIKKDRYKPTIYQNEMSQISVGEDKLYTERNQNGTETEPQIRLDKIRLELDKNRVDKGESVRGGEDPNAISPERRTPKKNKPAKHKYGECKNVLLTDRELERLKSIFPTDWQERIDDLSWYMASKGEPYKDHYATIRNWERKNARKAKDKPDDKKWATGDEPSAEAIIYGNSI